MRSERAAPTFRCRDLRVRSDTSSGRARLDDGGGEHGIEGSSSALEPLRIPARRSRSMQDAHDLAEVARVLGAILGLCSVAALDRAKLAPQVPPSLIAKGRAAGKRLLCDQRAVAVRAEAVCEHALKQRLRRPAHCLSVLPSWSSFR